MTLIARKNLLKNIPRFFVAQVGVMFAVSLVTIQTGLQSGFAHSSSLLIDKSKADIWICSNRMVNLDLPNTRAFTRTEMANMTQTYWQERSLIGFILGLGAVVGVIVGVVIVGQFLYASVSENLKEFGILKAIGASDWFIYNLIFEQALWMAVLGYLPGIALCYGVAAWTATQGIMILITPVSAIAIFGITVVMCISSAIFAIEKVTRVDPVIVFKA